MFKIKISTDMILEDSVLKIMRIRENINNYLRNTNDILSENKTWGALSYKGLRVSQKRDEFEEITKTKYYTTELFILLFDSTDNKNYELKTNISLWLSGKIRDVYFFNLKLITKQKSRVQKYNTERVKSINIDTVPTPSITIKIKDEYTGVISNDSLNILFTYIQSPSLKFLNDISIKYLSDKKYISLGNDFFTGRIYNIYDDFHKYYWIFICTDNNVRGYIISADCKIQSEFLLKKKSK